MVYTKACVFGRGWGVFDEGFFCSFLVWAKKERRIWPVDVQLNSNFCGFPEILNRVRYFLGVSTPTTPVLQTDPAYMQANQRYVSYDYNRHIPPLI